VTDVVKIMREVVQALLAEARRAPEVECCGLLAGNAGTITTAFPATNIAATATAYEIAPEELFRLFKQMRAEGLQHLGIYHSHPRGMNIPSPTDVQRAYYPEAAYFIISPLPQVAQPLRAFRIRDGRFVELKVALQQD